MNSIDFLVTHELDPSISITCRILTTHSFGVIFEAIEGRHPDVYRGTSSSLYGIMYDGDAVCHSLSPSDYLLPAGITRNLHIGKVRGAL